MTASVWLDFRRCTLGQAREWIHQQTPGGAEARVTLTLPREISGREYPHWRALIEKFRLGYGFVVLHLGGQATIYHAGLAGLVDAVTVDKAFSLETAPPVGRVMYAEACADAREGWSQLVRQGRNAGAEQALHTGFADTIEFWQEEHVCTTRLARHGRRRGRM